jgi:ABC-type polar amino acid transport system ATPase subunit
MTMLIVTHEYRFARDVATRVWEMGGGRVTGDEPAATSKALERY